MYYSLHEGHPHDNQTSIVNTTPRRRKGTLLLKQLSGDGKVTRQRYQQLLLVATEKLVSAYFSIDEVFLTLSSKGTCTCIHTCTVHVYTHAHVRTATCMCM